MSQNKNNRRIRTVGLLAVLLLCVALLLFPNLRSGNAEAQLTVPPPPPITNVQPEEADVRILMFGNSHTSMHGLPKMLATMLEEASPEKTYYIDRSRNTEFLAGKWDSPEVHDLFRSQPWDVLILQAQKYSVSGQYDYPTDAAENWIQAAHERDIRPILYPEWGQRGNVEEGRRVHALHRSIADKADSEIAPVGMAWEACLEQMPELELFARDGNHASAAGAYLTACVLVATITEKSPVGLTAPSFLDQASAELLQSIAWQTYSKFLPA